MSEDTHDIKELIRVTASLAATQAALAKQHGNLAEQQAELAKKIDALTAQQNQLVLRLESRRAWSAGAVWAGGIVAAVVMGWGHIKEFGKALFS